MKDEKAMITATLWKPVHKLNDISRRASYMDLNKRKLVVAPSFSSQLNTLVYLDVP